MRKLQVASIWKPLAILAKESQYLGRQQQMLMMCPIAIFVVFFSLGVFDFGCCYLLAFVFFCLVGRNLVIKTGLLKA